MAVSQLVLRLYKDQRLHTDPVPVVEGNEAKGKTGNLLFLLLLNVRVPATKHSTIVRYPLPKQAFSRFWRFWELGDLV